MSFVFNCRNCNAPLMAEDNWAGLETTCPHCGQQTLIQPANGGMAAPEAAFPEKIKKLPKWVIITAIVLAGLVVLGGITWGVVYFIENNPFASSVHVPSEEDQVREVAEKFLNADSIEEAAKCVHIDKQKYTKYYGRGGEIVEIEMGEDDDVKWAIVEIRNGGPVDGLKMAKDPDDDKWYIMDVDGHMRL